MMAYGENTSLAERKKRAALRMILGFEGLDISPEIKKFANRNAPAGYILFRRNVEEPAQVLEMNRALQDLNGKANPPLLSVDQEGGRVRRIRKSNWPPMRFLGNINDEVQTKKIADFLAEELLAMGFNTNWAPVADVDSNPKNPIIGDRSFGRSPEHCAQHVRYFLEAMQSRGVIGCVKHFPGHGDTDLDSHLELPTVEKDIPDLEACELLPFFHNLDITQIIMTAHVMFPAFDEKYPATMSHAIIHDLLRKKMGYNRIVVSDDMEMKAVRGRWPLRLQLDQSCRAGVDLFLFCKEPALQEEAFEELVRLQEESTLHDKLAIASTKRLLALQERFFLTPPKQPPISTVGCTKHQDLCALLRQRGES